jgi:dolichol-phosphate mannosyltransferase
MRALVTGAGGFIGANLVRHLAALGHEPVALVRPDGDRWRLADLGDEVAIEAVDLADEDAVRHVAARSRPEVIFHLAAHGAYSWQNDLGRMLATNVRATAALLDVTDELGAALVHAGSSSEYGYKDHPPREDEHVEPNSLYAVTKVTATHLCRLAAATRGTRAVTLRLYSIYGPWEEPGRLMPTLVERCLVGEWPPLVGPEIARDFVWVTDACEAFVQAAIAAGEQPGAVFNVASGTQTTLGALVAIAREVFEVAAEPVWGTMGPRRWDTAIWIGDPSGAERSLGWKAHTSLRDGLANIGGWLGAHSELQGRYAPA